MYVPGNISAAIRDITLSNTGGPANVAAALEINGASRQFSVVDTTLNASNASLPSFSAVGLWIDVGPNSPRIHNIKTFSSGAPVNYGIYTSGDGVMIFDSWISISGSGYSVYNNNGSGIRLVDSTVTAPTHQLVGRCANVFDINNDNYTCT